MLRYFLFALVHVVNPFLHKRYIYKILFFERNPQVFAVFLARRYRNLHDPELLPARAIFPQRNYLYWSSNTTEIPRCNTSRLKLEKLFCYRTPSFYRNIHTLNFKFKFKNILSIITTRAQCFEIIIYKLPQKMFVCFIIFFTYLPLHM